MYVCVYACMCVHMYGVWCMYGESFDRNVAKLVKESNTDIVCISLRNKEIHLNS